MRLRHIQCMCVSRAHRSVCSTRLFMGKNWSQRSIHLCQQACVKRDECRHTTNAAATACRASYLRTAAAVLLLVFEGSMVIWVKLLPQDSTGECIQA